MKKSIMSGLIAAAAAISFAAVNPPLRQSSSLPLKKAQRQFRRQPSPRRYLNL